MHRILFVAETLFPLGPAEPLLRLSSALTALGHEVIVAVLGQRTFDPTQWTDAAIEVHYLNGDDTTPLHNLRDGFFVARELRKLISETSPDIVHSWCGNAELLTLLATENFPLARKLNRIRLISTELYLQPEKRFVRQVTERKMARRVERMIVPHVAVKNHLVENGYREPRIDIIPNSISPKRNSVSNVATDRAKGRQRILSMLGLPDSVQLVGTVAPLIHRSRLKDLIFATNLLDCAFSEEWYAENKPGETAPNIHFLMIGKGTQKKQLKRFSILTEAKPQVHFLDHPDSPEEIVAGLDFYWHSHLRDPLSINLLTAMSKGIPAISVFGPGSQEIIRHQETGFAVNFGARDEFARWTKYLIEQKNAGQRLAHQGQTFVQSNFHESDMVESYVGVYDLTS
ncbi:MAG: glycosyltransferase family 4 protein [Mariniblastus sp.]